MTPSDRIMIVSMPKAGTHLLAEVLIQLGHSPTHMHVGSDSYDRYDPARLDDGRDHPEEHRVRSPWQETLKLIGPGQFAIGHLPFERVRLGALRDFRVLFLKRDPRECLVSHMRWTLSTRRRDRYPDAPWLEGDPRSQVVEFLKDRGWTLSNLYKSLLPWNDADGVCAVRFEDLIEQRRGGLLQHDAAAVGRAIGAARNCATRAGDAQPAGLLDCWSDRAEAVYRLLFKDLGRRLGYDDPAPHLRNREPADLGIVSGRRPASG